MAIILAEQLSDVMASQQHHLDHQTGKTTLSQQLNHIWASKSLSPAAAQAES